MRERGVASPARHVRLELARAPPQLDRAADGRVTLVMRGCDLLGVAFGAVQRRACGIPRLDVDVELRREVPELCEPEAMLVHEVERKLVQPRRDRPAHLQRSFDALTRRCAHRLPDAVPHDRVAAFVEPVVRDVQIAPGRAARVFERHLRTRDRAGLHVLELVDVPAHGERAGRNGMVRRHATTLRLVDPLLVRTSRREPVEHTPVWFMRQAGRSLPEYRELRKQYGLFDIVAQPELCAEVTLQPVRRHDVDAAVMFTDIMFPVLGMGVDVELVENVGPVIERPIRTRAEVERLVVPEPEESVPTILEAVRLVREELRDDQAGIGVFGGACLGAGVLLEGRPSREFAKVKSLMYREPATWHALMEKLTETSVRYVAAKAGAGADVIQVFDSWVGALSPSDYEEFVAPYAAR